MPNTKITFAGHAAIFIEISGAQVAIDPWLDGNPACPNNLKNPSKLDLIILTHGHADHASQAAALSKRLGSTIVATWELCNLLQREEKIPNESLVAMNKGGTCKIGNLSVTLTNAFHSSSYDTPTQTFYAGEACGTIVSDGRFTIYHAGDTCLFSDMSLIGKFYHPNVAILPIGDRFTMGPVEAAYAANLVGAKQVIPIHTGTFDILTGDPTVFKSECAKFEIEAILLKPGESFNFG